MANPVTGLVSSSRVREGYRVVSGAVDFRIDDVLDKVNGVIGDSMNLCVEREYNAFSNSTHSL